MSYALFPIDLITSIEVTPYARVNADTFESGTTNTRRLWPANYFKRHIKLTTCPLTDDESRFLRTFIAQRSGQYDSFFIRLNAHREGNAWVRLVKDPVRTWQGGKRVYQLELDEIAPIRALPDFDELATAAGQSALYWYDPNRERHTQSVLNGTPIVSYDPATYDVATLVNRAAWQGTTYEILTGLTGQYQAYQPSPSTAYAISGSIATIGTGQPACTLIALVNSANLSTRQVIASIGQPGNAVGIQITPGNQWAPWIGGSETWTGAQSANTASTWYSIAVTWDASSNVASLYVNAALIGTATNTRSLGSNCPITLHAASDGTLPYSGASAHIMAFSAALTLAQVKAVHNLLGYQYGLAIVP